MIISTCPLFMTKEDIIKSGIGAVTVTVQGALSWATGHPNVVALAICAVPVLFLTLVGLVLYKYGKRAPEERAPDSAQSQRQPKREGDSIKPLPRLLMRYVRRDNSEILELVNEADNGVSRIAVGPLSSEINNSFPLSFKSSPDLILGRQSEPCLVNFVTDERDVGHKSLYGFIRKMAEGARTWVTVSYEYEEDKYERDFEMRATQHDHINISPGPVRRLEASKARKEARKNASVMAAKEDVK